MKLKAAVAQVARQQGLAKNALYELALKMQRSRPRSAALGGRNAPLMMQIQGCNSWRVELPALPDPLPAPVVDSHCHLDSTQAKSGLEPEDAIRLAAEVGVTRIVQIGCDPEGCRWAVQAAERWPSVIAGVAIHPNDAARMGPELLSGLELVEALAQHPRVRAVGETGLDYFRTTDAGRSGRTAGGICGAHRLRQGVRQDPRRP